MYIYIYIYMEHPPGVNELIQQFFFKVYFIGMEQTIAKLVELPGFHENKIISLPSFIFIA